MCDPISAAIGSTLLPAAAGTAAVGGAAAAGSATMMSSLASAGTKLLIGGLSAGAESAASAERTNAHNAAVQQNAQSAKDAYFIKSRSANLRLLQEQTQVSHQKEDADIKALKSQGTAIAAAAGAGVQGVNVDQLINDFERSEGMLASRADQRLEGVQAQTAMEMLSYQSEANARINSMQPIGMAETLFGVAEPLLGFGLDYMDAKARFASVEA